MTNLNEGSARVAIAYFNTAMLRDALGLPKGATIERVDYDPALASHYFVISDERLPATATGAYIFRVNMMVRHGGTRTDIEIDRGNQIEGDIAADAAQEDLIIAAAALEMIRDDLPTTSAARVAGAALELIQQPSPTSIRRLAHVNTIIKSLEALLELREPAPAGNAA